MKRYGAICGADTNLLNRSSWMLARHMPPDIEEVSPGEAGGSPSGDLGTNRSTHYSQDICVYLGCRCRESRSDKAICQEIRGNVAGMLEQQRSCCAQPAGHPSALLRTASRPSISVGTKPLCRLTQAGVPELASASACPSA